MLVEFKDIRVKKLCPMGDAILAFNGENLDEWTTKQDSDTADKWVAGKAQVSASDPKQLEEVEGSGSCGSDIDIDNGLKCV